ncbi:MAG: histidine phosphatase family protein [Trueperaceae bacterium]|nr:histidine phosphatase family protein [Trueperaceae bacterium]
MNRFVHILVGLLLVGSVVYAQQSDVRDGLTPELVAALQDGGHVIYIRHAMTETDYADQVDATLSDCATQRVLSEAGWEQARDIGASFEVLEIPVAQVIASEYCRAWQTADLAFGRYVKNADLNFLPVADFSDEQMATMSERVTPFLSAVPVDGLNTVIVAHDDPFEAATGIYPEPQGVAYVVRPLGDDGFELLARVPADAWISTAR